MYAKCLKRALDFLLSLMALIVLFPILLILTVIGAVAMRATPEGRPIWKSMHEQPIFMNNPFVTREGNGRGLTNDYIGGGTVGADGKPLDVGMDLFHRGLCLPSDINMTSEQQDVVIEIVRRCFE